MAIRITDKVGTLISGVEILPYAKRRCSMCNGKGYLTVIDNNDKTKKTERPCGCALRNFLMEFPNVHVDDAQNLYWPPEGKAAAAAGGRHSGHGHSNGAEKAAATKDDDEYDRQMAQAERLERLTGERKKLADEIADIEARILEKQGVHVEERRQAEAATGETENDRLAALTMLEQARHLDEEAAEAEARIVELRRHILNLRERQAEQVATAQRDLAAADGALAAQAKVTKSIEDKLNGVRQKYRRELATLNSKLGQVDRRMRRVQTDLNLDHADNAGEPQPNEDTDGAAQI